jgi:phosphoribosylformimino-5-aminoimidazole carboxamide ribotide isomerase
MKIFPAIDLKDGQCVRLTQGNFKTAKIYETDPELQAYKFADAGAEWLHMVDLDGARKGKIQQFSVIANLAKQVPMKIQVGGGIRDKETIEKLLSAGVKRVVIGSLAVKNRPLVLEWLREFGPEHVVLAFDIKLTDNEPEILTHGWQSGSQQLLWDTLDAYEGSGLKNILCTDVSRDGMLTGTNHGLYQVIQKRWPTLEVLASGGVSGLDDLLDLAKLGLSGAVVGKAIYEGHIDLADAIQKVKNAG